MVYIHISETYTSLLKSVTKLTARLIYIYIANLQPSNLNCHQLNEYLTQNEFIKATHKLWYRSMKNYSI